MKPIISFAFLLTALVSSFLVNGQSPTLPKVISPSPNAAALGKFGDIPVSQYTGSATISVPLYTIQSGDIIIPITLDYHTGGIRLNELAGWTGLGWVLNAGGVVTRTILDKDDLSFFGSGSNYPSLVTKGQIYPSSLVVLAGPNMQTTVNTTKGEVFDFSSVVQSLDSYDHEPDVFSFNFFGNSGRFVFTRDGSVIMEKKVDYKIDFNQTTQNFKITDDSGFIYFFETKEVASLDPFVGSYISSWYLTKMESPKGEIANFIYETATLPVLQQYIHTSTLGGFNGGGDTNTLRGSSFSTAQILKRIDYSQGNVEFTNDAARLDYSSKRITGLKSFLTGASAPSSQYDFVYSYFASNSRLRLDKVIQKSGTQELSPNVFSYINSVPGSGSTSLSSFSVDYWGYYNGKSNASLVPELITLNNMVSVGSIVPDGSNPWFVQYISSYPYLKLAGANRNTDKEAARLFSLSEIKYPTGGSTLIETEAHTFEYDDAEAIRQLPSAQLLERDTVLIFESRGDVYGNLSNFINLVQAYNIKATIGFICTNPTNGCATFRNSATYPYSSIYFTLNGNSRDIAGEFVSCGGPQCSCELTIPVNTISVPYQAHIASNVGSEFVRISVHLTWTEQMLNHQSNKNKFLYSGGLRIRKISNVDENGFLIGTKKYDYHFTNDSNSDGIMEIHSYGKRMAPPRFYGNAIVPFPKDGAGGFAYCQTFTRFSNSVIPLSSSVCYDQVIETLVDHSGLNDIGKTIYFFENKQDSIYTYSIPGFSNLRPMGIPNLTYKKNGLMNRKIDYMRVGSQYQIVREVNNEYSSLILNNYFGFKLEPLQMASNPGGNAQLLYITPILRAERIQLKRTIEKQYDQSDANKILTTQSDYVYSNNHERPVEITKVHSSGKTEIQKMVYPQDYGTISSPGNGIKNLKDKNILAPVEQYSIVDGSVVSGSLTTFKPSFPFPDQVYKLETANPVLLSGFGYSNKTANTFSIDSRYVPRINYEQYDEFGNIEMVSKSNDHKLVYIWGYNKKYPIAEVRNGEYLQVAHTSFESGSNEGNFIFSGLTSNTGVAKSGKYYYSLTSSTPISKSLAAGKYKLEYYAKAPVTISGGAVVDTYTSGPDANGWILYNKELSLSTATTVKLSVPGGSVFMDDVRLFPVGAQMSTYTYDPLIGMTSSTDANHRSLYYKYDLFNRLEIIRDDDGKILKTYQYHYKQ